MYINANVVELNHGDIEVLTTVVEYINVHTLHYLTLKKKDSRCKRDNIIRTMVHLNVYNSWDIYGLP